MLTEARIFRIVDSSIKDISKRVAKIEVVSLPNMEVLPAERPWTLFAKTEGDYDLIMILSTDHKVFREISRNMKRSGDASEAEILIYMKEFFNIWCGHVISAVNQSGCLSAEFAVSELIEGHYEHSSECPAKFHGQYYYESPYGTMKLETLYCS